MIKYIKEKFEPSFLWYQRSMWYVANMRNEIGKPMAFYQDAGMLILLLKSFNVILTWWQAVVGYISIIIIAATLGWIVVNMGVVEYSTRLNNKQNPELQAIINKLDEIEKRIK